MFKRDTNQKTRTNNAPVILLNINVEDMKGTIFQQNHKFFKPNPDFITRMLRNVIKVIAGNRLRYSKIMHIKQRKYPNSFVALFANCNNKGLSSF